MADVEKTYLVDIIDGDSGEIVKTLDFTVSASFDLDEATDPPGYGDGEYDAGGYGE